jgi:hypothetical protein
MANDLLMAYQGIPPQRNNGRVNKTTSGDLNKTGPQRNSTGTQLGAEQVTARTGSFRPKSRIKITHILTRRPDAPSNLTPDRQLPDNEVLELDRRPDTAPETFAAFAKSISKSLQLSEGELGVVLGIGKDPEHQPYVRAFSEGRSPPVLFQDTRERIDVLVDILSTVSVLVHGDGCIDLTRIYTFLTSPRPDGSLLSRIKTGNKTQLEDVRFILDGEAGGVWGYGNAGTSTRQQP